MKYLIAVMVCIFQISCSNTGTLPAKPDATGGADNTQHEADITPDILLQPDQQVSDASAPDTSDEAEDADSNTDTILADTIHTDTESADTTEAEQPDTDIPVVHCSENYKNWIPMLVGGTIENPQYENKCLTDVLTYTPGTHRKNTWYGIHEAEFCPEPMNGKKKKVLDLYDLQRLVRPIGPVPQPCKIGKSVSFIVKTCTPDLVEIDAPYTTAGEVSGIGLSAYKLSGCENYAYDCIEDPAQADYGKAWPHMVPPEYTSLVAEITSKSNTPIYARYPGRNGTLFFWPGHGLVFTVTTEIVSHGIVVDGKFDPWDRLGEKEYKYICVEY